MILALFDQLLDETRRHFISEEELFEQYHFPGSQEHKTEHLKLLASLAGLNTLFHNQGGKFIALQDIKAWLLNHIQYANKDAAAFLLARGAK